MKHKTLGVLAILFLLAAPIPSNSAPRHTGVRGQTSIFRGPPAPPGPITQPIVRHFPVSASITIRSARTGRTVARVRSDANGNFQVSLKPGKYVLVPQTLADPLPFGAPRYYTPDPIKVTVRPHRFTSAFVTYLFPVRPISANPTP